MATIKFPYGGTNYSLVATSSKITTPSIKVGGSYIPLFSGGNGDTVVNGSNVYILSPMRVGIHRPPSGVVNTSGTVTVYISYYYGYDSSYQTRNHSEWSGNSPNSHTDYCCRTYYYAGVTGYSISNSNLSVSLTNLSGLSYGTPCFTTRDSWYCRSTGYPDNWTFTLSVSGTYILSYRKSTVKTGTFSGSVDARFNSTSSRTTSISFSV